jgi:antitoxin VapB
VDILRGDVPLYIKDDATAALVGQLAALRGLTKQAAVRLAVQAELERTLATLPLRDRLAALWQAHPLPPPTATPADKAFFDELSGGL